MFMTQKTLNKFLEKRSTNVINKFEVKKTVLMIYLTILFFIYSLNPIILLKESLEFNIYLIFILAPPLFVYTKNLAYFF